MPVMELQRHDSRRDQILERAATLFGESGYDRTSIRDIAAAVGMLPGSVYYHFPSKEALLAAVYTAAIDQAIETLQAATADHKDPWDRLEAASVAHLGILVGGGSIAVVIADGRNLPETARAQLIQQRHRYETIFRDMVAELDLPSGVTASSFRLALMGALNWALTWFRPDGDPAETVARNIFAVFRAGRPSSS
jgi:AcrR family transcriptional regulator